MKNLKIFLFMMLFLFVGLGGVKADDLAEGVYIIKSALDNNKVVEVDTNTGNVQINENTGANNQKWRLERTSNGYYRIVSMYDESKVLDVAWGGTSNGTNVQVYDINNSSSQNWYFKDAGNGYYNLVSQVSGLNLDVYGAISDNGTNVQTWENNGNNAQKFVIVEDIQGSQTLDDGIYKISTALNNNMMLDVAGANTANQTNVQLYERNGNNAQLWKVKYLNNGFYSITTYLDDSKYLDLAGAWEGNQGNIQIYEYTGSFAQRWIIKDCGDGYYNIVTSNNHKYIDVAWGSAANNSNVQIFQPNGTNSQKWKFEKVEMKTLEDGIYNIRSLLDENKGLSVVDDNALDSTNVDLQTIENGNNQKWYVKHLGGGLYSVSSILNPKRVLDVAWGGTSNGTNVQIYLNNNTAAQKWYIQYIGNDAYNVINQNSGLLLDVSGANTAEHTNIQTYQSNGNNAQKWKFTRVDYQSFEDGVYTIHSMLNENMVAGIRGISPKNNTNVELQISTGENNQKWNVTNLGNGLYSISSVLDSNQMLDVDGAGMVNGTNVQTYQSNGNAAQKWYLIDVGDGSYNVISDNNGLLLDVYGAYTDEHTNIQVYEKNGNAAQRWKFVKSDVNEYGQTYENGYYNIASMLNDNYLLDAYGALKANGTNVQLYQSNGNNAQIWYLKYLSNGYYSIASAMNPDVSLDVANGGMVNGTNVQLYRYNDSDSQKWLLKVNSDGSVSFVSKQNGLYMDVVNGVAGNGSNVQVYEGNGSLAQRFKLIKNDSQKIYKGIDVSYHQGNIDWESVASTGIDFVIIRAGYGSDFVDQDDDKLFEYVEGCEKYNIPYGLYLYSYATEVDSGSTTAVSEANHLLRLANELKRLGYNPNLGTRVFFDIEDSRFISYGKDKTTQIADRFCSVVEENGYSCGIYSYKKFLENYIDIQYLATKYPVWIAQYPNGVNRYDQVINSKPNYNLTSYKFWQFASNGNVAGINGNVDMDLGYDIFD